LILLFYSGFYHQPDSRPWKYIVYKTLSCVLLANYLGILKDKKGKKKALVGFCSEILLPKWKKKKCDKYLSLALK